MSKRVAVIPGDGVGKEVVPVGVALIEQVKSVRGYAIELEHYDFGADRFLRDGTTFPSSASEHIQSNCDAVLLGALGDPRVKDLSYARDILFGMRFGYDLYCNQRPITCLSDSLMPLKGVGASDVDIVVFRENTEGLYVNIGGRFKQGTPDEIAITESINTRKGVERIIRAAFDCAVATGRKSVHMADKSNALPAAHGLWRDTFKAVAADYPGIAAKPIYVDALCMFLVKDPTPFEVIVTSNLLGDIVTDLGAALQGGMGMAASGNIHPGRISLFEPVHGSAPDIAGQDKANPMATVLSVGMLLEHIGFSGEQARMTELCRRALEAGQRTRDIGGELGTKAVGDWLVAHYAELD